MDKKNIKKEGGQPKNKNAEKRTEIQASKIGEKLIKWLSDKDENGEPTSNIFFKQFLMDNDMYDTEIAYLSKKYESFSKLIKKASEIQELKLMGFGVANKLNPTMTIFILKNKHSWKDKTEQEITGKDGKDLVPTMTFKIDDTAKQTFASNEREVDN